MTRGKVYALSAADAEFLEYRSRQLMAEQGLGRLRAMDAALAELRADVDALGEDELIRAHGAEPGEVDARLRDPLA